MRIYGLIGFPLEHSFSESYFREKFTKERIQDCVYKMFPIKSINDFPAFIKNNHLQGLNITIPYKQAIMPYLDAIDTEAMEVGAVNCITIENHSDKPFLKGYNTDIYGFETLLKQATIPLHCKVLILGSGGSSLAVAYILRKHSIQFSIVSRNTSSDNSMRYNELNREYIESHLIIINTTPLGMFPDIDKSPEIPYRFITANHICIDLIYNPSKTSFLAQSELQGAKTIGGLDMLYAQAEHSWLIWNK